MKDYFFNTLLPKLGGAIILTSPIQVLIAIWVNHPILWKIVSSEATLILFLVILLQFREKSAE